MKMAAVLALALAANTAMAADESAKALTNLTSTLGTYLAVLAGTGGLVVALLESYKKLFSIRGKFHRTAVIRWLSQHKSAIPDALQVAKPGLLSAAVLGGSDHYDVPVGRDATTADTPAGAVPYDAEAAYAEFFHLTSGQAQPAEPHPSTAVLRWRGVDRAVFELETSRMMSQVQDGADVVLNNPGLYPHLYAFFTRGSNGTDAAAWKAFISEEAPPPPTKADSERYARVRMLMKRQLDAFQTVTCCRWEDLNQMWAMVLGAVVLFVALVMASQPDFDSKAFDPVVSLIDGFAALAGDPSLFMGVVLKAALGGALAPLAKDLLNSISSIKFTR
ncbi:hypothetical protein ASD35_11650 [Pelomonas sp. Root1444]|nr:hypothetical protein ASD35_11650 [Pelomonas sp. Root1444]